MKAIYNLSVVSVKIVNVANPEVLIQPFVKNFKKLNLRGAFSIFVPESFPQIDV